MNKGVPAEGLLVDARRVEGPGAPPANDFHFRELSPRRPAANGDKRGAARQRTRLRSGKVIDVDDRFLSECLVFDRSDIGGRLRLPEAVALPMRIQFFDDQSATLFQADVVWRRGLDIGLRFRPFVTTARTRALATSMRGRFYKVAD